MVDDEVEADLCEIQNPKSLITEESRNSIKIKLRIHKDEYFEKVSKMLTHIQRGDIYEANFCQEFYSKIA